MTVWEWICATEGWALANGATPKGNGDISEDRLAEMGIDGFD